MTALRRTREVWQYISERQAQGKPPASHREIGHSIGRLSRGSVVAEAMRVLCAAGYVEMVGIKSRAYSVVVPLHSYPGLSKRLDRSEKVQINRVVCTCGVVHYPRQPKVCPFAGRVSP